jgi:hypothetical protein
MDNATKYADLQKDKERVAFVKLQLQTNDRWLKRGLVAIYKLQTATEQATLTTRVVNNVGFSAFDAEFLSAMAQRVEAGYNLSFKQLAAVRKGMVKYAGQLVRIANANPAPTKPEYEVYEIGNTFTKDIPLGEQIELKICDWVVEFTDGRTFYGHTKAEAIKNAGITA